MAPAGMTAAEAWLPNTFPPRAVLWPSFTETRAEMWPACGWTTERKCDSTRRRRTTDKRCCSQSRVTIEGWTQPGESEIYAATITNETSGKLSWWIDRRPAFRKAAASRCH